MAHWLDRLAIAVTEAEDQRISRRDALRGGGRLAGAAIVGSTVAGVVAPAASAAGNSYCLAACLAVADNGFNVLIAACKETYLKSFGLPADAVNEVNCVAKTHSALKLALARCGKPFCGSKKLYPPAPGPGPGPQARAADQAASATPGRRTWVRWCVRLRIRMWAGGVLRR